jgi:Alpha/beta hydrolase domain
VLIACFTVLPSRVNRAIFVIDINGIVDSQLVGRVAIIGALVAAVLLAAMAWRRRRVWIARLSWPLIGWLALGVIGLAALVLISQPPGYLRRHGLGEIAWLSQDFDSRHSIFYAGFAIVAGLAWRDRASLPVLGLLLMAYGYLLELAQHFVPTRTFLIKDLVSNGVGIVLGLGWVYLYDALFGAKRPRSSRPARRLRRRSARTGATLVLAALGIALASGRSEAVVERLEVLQREPFAGGAAFGKVGRYERVVGRLHFAVDPDHPANAPVVDLALAPRDERGLVTFVADFVLLRPEDLARGNHRLLYEVNNRGNLGALAFFNEAPWSNDPSTPEDAGNGFLLERGYSLLWSGWNWDVLPGDGRLQIELPVATAAGAPITGTIAAEFVVGQWTRSAPFMWGNSRGYPPLSLDAPDARLTVRDEPGGLRREIARDLWRFARLEGDRLVPDRSHVFHVAGFEPGRIYEVVYEARGPRVVGLGLAAIRDAISFFRFETEDGAGGANPLAEAGAPDPETALIFGISQSGRVIQHMLWQALHVDEAGRMTFDGALVHVAGAGKGSFNHRFAQTTRHPSQLEDHEYPADFFPFATTPTRDPVSGASGDVLARARAAGAVPRLVYTTTSTEYWTRAASLLHTVVTGGRDVPLDPSARLYFIAGAQHGNWRFAERGPYQNCGNPLDHRPPLRALLLALDAWVTKGREPPPSVYPRLDDGTLGSVEDYRGAFPKIPGIALPGGNLRPPRLDLGPRFVSHGIADRQPPEFGPAFVTRVPLPDADGNDLGGIRLPAVAVPVGTYTGWNLRHPEVGAPDKLARWSGSFLPFASDETTRASTGDPRPSLAERYASRDDYRTRIETAARSLAADGFLLEHDLAAITERAVAFYDGVRAHEAADPSCAYTLGE